MHRFVSNGYFSVKDLSRLIYLTRGGELGWRASDRFAAYLAVPLGRLHAEDPRPWRNIVGVNITDVRLGFDPRTQAWTYVRIVSEAGLKYYVDRTSPPRSRREADELYLLAQKAIRLGGSLDPSCLAQCVTCRKSTPHRALYDAVHGIPNAVMAGSERRVCVVCERATPLEAAKSAR